MSRNHVDPSKKNEQILLDLLKVEANKYCADCGQKGTRWASWNIGVFLCIRCGGLHRSLGTHISKVKSVTLDKWTDEQIESIKSKGNSKVNLLYNSHPDKHPFPTFSGDMENYIRDKYERKLFMSGESAAGSTQMSLKSHSSERRKSNLLDSEALVNTGNSSGFRECSAAEGMETNYSKQLTLLSEMGFTDSDFNYKTLRAANGNLQEALEIIVAANQKSRKKTVERNNIFDEINQETSTKDASVNIEIKEKFQSSPPIQMDDWGFDSTPIVEMNNKESVESVKSNSNVEVIEPKSKSSTNPWDEDQSENSKETESKKPHDPFDTYKAFSSTTSDTYFDNPW